MGSETPTTSDAEGVYDISIKLKLESLAHKAFHFLQATTTIQNVTARAFAMFAVEHPEVGKWYDAYFLDHWDEIRKQKEHLEFMQHPGDDRNRVMTKFYELFVARK